MEKGVVYISRGCPGLRERIEVVGDFNSVWHLLISLVPA